MALDVREEMGKRPLVKHLFARMNEEITVETRKKPIMGVLRSIDLELKFIEVNNKKERKTFFINLINIIDIEAPGSEEIVRRKQNRYHNPKYSR